MKKTKNKQKATDTTTRDLVLANKMSGKIHGGLSRIRLSLTFRIALHYSLQLLRSFLPLCIILTVLFCVCISFPISRSIENAVIREKNGNSDPDGYVTVVPYDGEREEGFFQRIGQQTGLIFRSGLLEKQLWFYYSSSQAEEWKVCLDLSDIIRLWLFMIAGALLGDLFRSFYFFRHDQRLNKRVLSPIRDIASMAATLSENNLSNRINIAGTKNELKDLASVINSMLDRIERSYNSQKQFVSDASHELRTPISVIRGYTDMLKRWGKDDPEILDEGIAAILQETEGMKELVESLLFLARHDKKTLMMEISSFDPSELIREIKKEEEMVHDQYNFRTGIIESSLVKADRNMIKQVLRILCDNAVKYSPQGTEVILSCTSDEHGTCCLSVKDQGQGITQEDLPKVFDRFYRSDKARKSDTGGHGLGLSIARIIVVAHNGKIRVRSKPGSGTVFSVILPAMGEGENIT